MKVLFKNFIRYFYSFCLIFTISAFPQSPGDVKVNIENNESLRSIAKKYLGSPNDWEIILHYNNMQSSDEIRIGQQLWIPVEKYKKIMNLIENCRSIVTKANTEGAGILAEENIKSAIEQLNSSIHAKKMGKLELAEQKAKHAVEEATLALSITREKRMQSIAAILAEKKGTVQYRKYDALRWSEARLRQELIEKDHLRTLSRSYGMVKFIDGSHIQIDANALIVIEAVKKDIINNNSSADILVLEGDVSTLIQSISKKNNFKVTSPGIETNIRSRNFITSRDVKKTTRFSNFDGEMDVVSEGEKVTLTKNEGTKVKLGSVPDNPKKLLDHPKMIHPVDGKSLFDSIIFFQWQAVKSAQMYQIQISQNKIFTKIETSITVEDTFSVAWEAPDNGTYYWRIRAVDEELLYGPYSKTRQFSVLVDNTPPFLQVTSPSADTVVFNNEVRIRGKTENNALVTVNQDTVQVDENGEFICQLKLRHGDQDVNISAVDRNGNKSQIERNIMCSLEKEIVFLENEENIISNVNRVVIKGHTKPRVELTIDNQNVQIHNRTFTYCLNKKEGIHQINLEAQTFDGHIQKKKINLIIDTTPPELIMENLPNYTELTSVDLKGSVSEPANLYLNDEPVTVKQNQFSIKLPLKPGKNIVHLKLIDRAGNYTERSFTINQDKKPPEILSYELSSDNITGGDIVYVIVKSEDRGAGLARTGTFIIETIPDKKQLSGLLKLNHESHIYNGSCQIPPDISGHIKLKKLYISDYLGNTTRFE